MGLDLAEIMLSIEDEFNIDILESSAASVETVSDLVDYVEKEIRKNEIPRWKAKQIYADSLSKVKHELASALNISESSITPDVELEKLIPRRLRRQVWNSSPFFTEIGSLSSGCGQIVFMAIVGFLALIFFAYGEKLHDNFGAFLGLIVAMTATVSVFIGIGLLLPRTTINSSARNVADCARLLAAKEGARLNKDGENWTREQIELQIREIISEQAGIKLDQIKLEHRLVKDLNLG